MIGGYGGGGNGGHVYDVAALERRYEATDVWSAGYAEGVKDARGERKTVVNTVFAVGIVVGGFFAVAIMIIAR